MDRGADKQPVVHLVEGKRKPIIIAAADYDRDRQWKSFQSEIPAEIGTPNRNLIIAFLETYDEGPAEVEWPGGVALGSPFSADGGLAIFTAWILKDDFTAASEADQRRLFQDATPILGRTAAAQAGPIRHGSNSWKTASARSCTRWVTPWG